MRYSKLAACVIKSCVEVLVSNTSLVGVGRHHEGALLKQAPRYQRDYEAWNED